MIVISLFEKMVDKKSDKVRFDSLPKAKGKYKSVTFDFLKFIDSNTFLSSSLDSLVKTFVDDSHKTLK